jgi:F0F1-type ATP synthase assembly protein I
MKYPIIFISALIIEICSTFYINYVAHKNPIGMIIFAAIGPFLGLPFAGYMVESKSWSERIKMAFALSLGYIAGCLIVLNFIK